MVGCGGGVVDSASVGGTGLCLSLWGEAVAVGPVGWVGLQALLVSVV